MDGINFDLSTIRLWSKDKKTLKRMATKAEFEFSEIHLMSCLIGFALSNEAKFLDYLKLY